MRFPHVVAHVAVFSRLETAVTLAQTDFKSV